MAERALVGPPLRDPRQLLVPFELHHVGRGRLRAGGAAGLLAGGHLGAELVVEVEEEVLLAPVQSLAERIAALRARSLDFEDEIAEIKRGTLSMFGGLISFKVFKREKFSIAL